jgi:hypothetical protein
MYHNLLDALLVIAAVKIATLGVLLVYIQAAQRLR